MTLSRLTVGSSSMQIGQTMTLLGVGPVALWFDKELLGGVLWGALRRWNKIIW